MVASGKAIRLWSCASGETATFRFDTEEQKQERRIVSDSRLLSRNSYIQEVLCKTVGLKYVLVAGRGHGHTDDDTTRIALVTADVVYLTVSRGVMRYKHGIDTLSSRIG